VPIGVSNVSLSPATFYPTVRDGYRDTTTMSYRLNQKADVIARVTNSNGPRVRSADLGRLGAGTRSWRWDGRTNSGTPVATGKYQITLTATSAAGTGIVDVSRTATAATGWTTKRVTKSRTGANTSTVHVGNSCYAPPALLGRRRHLPLLLVRRLGRGHLPVQPARQRLRRGVGRLRAGVLLQHRPVDPHRHPDHLYLLRDPGQGHLRPAPTRSTAPESPTAPRVRI